MNINIETVSTETFTMEFFRFGRGEKTFVILPGLSVQSVMGFANSVAGEYRIFSDEYTIYVFDRRKDLPAAYTVRDMARDTAEAMRALGLSQADLMGASQGGMIAMEIAVRNPDLVRRLALASTSSRVDEEQYGAIGKWVSLAKAGDREELYLAFGEAVYPGDVFAQMKMLLAAMAKNVTDEDLQRFVVLAEGAKDFDVTEDLKKITCPVLVIGSLDDGVLGAAASVTIARNLPAQKGVVLHMYDGYGHAAYDTAPDYRKRLLQWFRG